MNIKISYWFNNFQAPSVLMIDDLSDAYLKIYNDEYMNDWGYLCNNQNSLYNFLHTNLLKEYPYIKITFFIPYLKHNVINDNAKNYFIKHAVGEREEFSKFLKFLILQGHEIAHHGSNHGEYINNELFTTSNNFIHEWELFDDINEGVIKTKRGKYIFKKYINTNITGGKFCGYKTIYNSLEIIDKCNFFYWCNEVNYISNKYDYYFFAKNNIISFPTNFAGNSFVRLSYLTGNKKIDYKKKLLKKLQTIYNIFQYRKLAKLYKNKTIISIQEHYSPSTSSGLTQSANIVSDIKSLKKIYDFLSTKSIWYATCNDIAKYIYIKSNVRLKIINNKIIIKFNNYKHINNATISLVSNKQFTLIDSKKNKYIAVYNNNKFVVNVNIKNGNNIFKGLINE